MSRIGNPLRLVASPDGFALYDANRQKVAAMAVDVMIRPGGQSLMQVVLPAGPVDVVGSASFVVSDPASGKPRVVSRVVWADGEETVFPVPAPPIAVP